MRTQKTYLLPKIILCTNFINVSSVQFHFCVAGRGWLLQQFRKQKIPFVLAILILIITIKINHTTFLTSVIMQIPLLNKLVKINLFPRTSRGEFDHRLLRWPQELLCIRPQLGSDFSTSLCLAISYCVTGKTKCKIYTNE